MNKQYFIGFGISILAGAAIGGAVALLYAPKSGKETRRLIKDKASGMADAVKENATGAIHKVKEAASEVGRKGHAVADVIKI
jgi:gas vesicle protein